LKRSQYTLETARAEIVTDMQQLKE